MITQRQIRVRAMQAVYSYHVRVKANYLLALEFLEDKLRPGYTNKEVLAEEAIQEKIKLCISEFGKGYAEEFRKKFFKGNAEEKKLKETSKYLSELNNSDLANIIKQSIDSFELFETCYLTYFSVFVDISNYLNVSHKIIKPDIKLLQEYLNHDEIHEQTGNCKNFIKDKKFSPGYRNDNEFIDELISTDILKISKEINLLEPTKNINNNLHSFTFFMTKILFNSPFLEDYFENLNLFWNDDSHTIKHRVFQTINEMNNGKTGSSEKASVPSRKESFIFLKALVEKTILNEKSYMPLVREKSKNWDVERIQEVDKILIMMALCELLKFKNIPSSVTMDEYIEISKLYCSPKSRPFVNGVLDSIYKELLGEGKIKKSG